MDCLAGHTKLEKNGSLHLVYRIEEFDADEPIASARCTPKGRIIVLEPSYNDDGNFVPESLALIDPKTNKLLLHPFIDAADYSPDNRLIVYDSWNGAHGGMSVVSTLYLLDADGEGERDDIPLYPSQAESAGPDEGPDEWASEWLQKPQPGDVIWFGSRKMMIVMFHVDDSSLGWSKLPISVASIDIDLAEGKPPVAKRTFFPPPPCLLDIYAHAKGGDGSHDQAACLAKSLGQHP